MTDRDGETFWWSAEVILRHQNDAQSRRDVSLARPLLAYSQRLLDERILLMLPWYLIDRALPLPIIDGSQFWTDQLWRGGYRLQTHAIGGHWRVLTPQGRRCAIGSEQECLEALERLAGGVDDHSAPEQIVILLHGLLRTRRCMLKMELGLRAAGLNSVIRFDYASTRQPIERGAAGLRRLVEGLPVSSRLSFVGHSMGNIVLRYAIGMWQREGDPRAVLPRMHRVVMLGPPNQGAAIARILSKLRLFGLVVGEGGLALGPNWETLLPNLAIPPCPFAILAGDLSGTRIRNPLIDAASDLLVTVEEAKLEGAAKFETVPIIHARQMFDPRAIAFAAEFLLQPFEEPAKQIVAQR